MSELPVLPYGRQTIEDDDIDEVVACLRGDWLTQGPRVAQMEAALRETLGAPHALACSNGTSALHLTYSGLGIGPGDRVLVPAITFVASANAAAHAGAEVEFVDVEPDTGLMDLDVLEARLKSGPAPKAVVAVHLAGAVVDMPRLRRLATEVGAAVVEDACHAPGATYAAGGETHRVGACAHSDAATLSFHPVKHVTTGEGGAVLCADPGLAERIGRMRTHGVHKDATRMQRSEEDPFRGPWYYEMDALGYNYRLPDLACALGITQLRKLARFLERRRALAAAYDEGFAQGTISGRLRPLRKPSGQLGAYHLYVVQVVPQLGEAPEEVAARRGALYAFLRERRIFTQVHYIPVPWQPYWRARVAPDARFPGAEAYYAASLSLPMYPGMEDGDVTRVLDALAAWAGA